MNTQSLYQRAIRFATIKHVEKNQMVPGTNMPYVVHLSNVAMEILIAGVRVPNFNLDFAMQLALLHDTLEDTDTHFEELAREFGGEIAQGVEALTKNDALPKNEKMIDSLLRIKMLSKEVWAVKIADRITNLQKPPDSWNQEKRKLYQQEAVLIRQQLRGANAFLEERLEKLIVDYGDFM